MRGSPKSKLAVFTAVSGIAGLAIFGSCSAVRAAEKGPQTKPSGVEVKNGDGDGIELRADTIRLQLDGKSGDLSKVISAEDANGQPVVIRIVSDAPAGKDAGDENDIVRRLRERRAEEVTKEDRVRLLRDRLAQDEPGSVRIEAETRGDKPAQEKLRGLVDELAKKAASMVSPGKKEKVTFLGVGASPAPAVLTHQLHLPADFGLVIDEVVPEGPADKAGLKEFDLLQKLDDQLLVDDQQLTALIHSHKPGEEITLTVIREGKPLTLKAKLGEHEEVAQGDDPHRFMLQFGLPPGAEGAGPAAIKAMSRLAPELRGPEGWKLPPMPSQPVPPGGGAVVSPPEARKPVAPNANNPRPQPQARPTAPADQQIAGGDEARRLEEELRSLKATADGLRAQLEARKKEEAEQQKSNGPVDKDQKDGAKP